VGKEKGGEKREKKKKAATFFAGNQGCAPSAPLVNAELESEKEGGGGGERGKGGGIFPSPDSVQRLVAQLDRRAFW